MLEDVVNLGREDLVQLLLENGADANNHWEPIVSALSGGNPAIVRVLIKHGVDLKKGAHLAWAFGKYAHRSLVGIFKELVRDDPENIIQATQALNEQLFSVDDLEMEDYKRTPLECAVRSGNLAFIKTANLDPAKDDIAPISASAAHFTALMAFPSMQQQSGAFSQTCCSAGSDRRFIGRQSLTFSHSTAWQSVTGLANVDHAKSWKRVTRLT
jgi:hypothetical protein